MDAIFILGMHRSGTSCLASCLEACGLHLGDVNRRPGSADNPHGTFEPFDVAELNESLLRSWIRPRLPVRPSAQEERRIAACAESLITTARNRGAIRLGLKDPRLVLVLEHWRRHFRRVVFVASFRDAEAVHRSIQARGELRTWRRANLKAWKTYNRALLELCQREPVHLLSFDQPAETYLAQLREICGRIGLEWNEDAVHSRFDPALRRQEQAESGRDAEVNELLAQLHRATDFPQTEPAQGVRA